MEVKTIKINTKEIDYFSFGNGKRNMVIIPGLSLKSVMLSKEAVASAYSLFKEDFTVYVFDKAKNMSAGYSVYDMADDVALAMKTLGIDSSYIFGASQGGMIAQVIAIKYPELVSKLVVGSSASRLNETAKSNIEHWAMLADNESVVELNHSIFTLLYSKETLNALGSALKNLEKDGTDEEMKQFSIQAKACISFDVYNKLENIKCPVLVIGAKNDRVLTGEASVEIAEKLKCELHMYDGEHAVYDETPDYKNRIYNFFCK